MDTNYSVLVNVTYPDIEQNFDMYIPTVKSVAYICQLFQKFIKEVVVPTYPIKESVTLVNVRTGEKYDLNKLVIDTTIRNGTKLVIY